MDYEYNLQVDGDNHLYVRIYKNEKLNNNQKTNVLYVVHGLNEHSGRYEFLKETGADFDYIVFYDHIGHGKSSGKRAYIKHFSGFSIHLMQVIRFSQNELAARFGVTKGGINNHIFGHSMGGMISLDFLDDNADKDKGYNIKIGSAIISAPFIDPVLKNTKDKIDNFLGSFLYSTFKSLGGVSIKKDLAYYISKDEKEVNAYRKDELNSDKITFALFFSQKEVRDKFLCSEKKHNHPILFLSPQEDFLSEPKSVGKAFEKLNCENKKIIKYDKSYHESFRCVEKDLVFRNIKSFWVKVIKK